jgi:Fe-S-cluster containining protein
VIKQIVPQEVCLKCQGCCRFSEQDSVWLPHLLGEEIQELLKKNFPPSLISQDKNIRSVPYPKQNNFICSFFQPKDNKCAIYAFRPFECQLYPFLVNRKDDNVFLAVDLRCPFVKESLESQEFKEYIRYLTSFFNSPRRIKILKNNPQIIQIYEDVLNLAELNP